MNIETMKLGRRPPKNAPALMLAPLLTGVVPVAPVAADHFGKVRSWVLGENDQYGDCGPVSMANNRLLVTTYLTGQPVTVSQADIFDLYKRSGNPTFDPKDPGGPGDGGVDMQTMLEAAVAGGIAGVKPIAFAKVNVGSLNELRDAVAIFGSLLLGVTLDKAQQAQTDAGLWDYKSSSIWGGHAILTGRYSEAPDRTAVITWANVVDMTDAFMAHQLDEAWAVIWPEHFGSLAFMSGVDIATLAADFRALTGRTLPVPAPAPAPAPTTLDPADMALADAVRAWASARHAGSTSLAAKAVQVWLKAKGL